MRAGLSKPYRVGLWVSVFAPVIVASICNEISGRELAAKGVALTLGFLFGAWLMAGLINVFKRHFADSATRRMAWSGTPRLRPTKPGPAALISTGVFLLMSLPFLLVAHMIADMSRGDSCGWVAVSVFTVFSLGPQWMAWRRLSIYLHEYAAWRDWRKPAGREAR